MGTSKQIKLSVIIPYTHSEDTNRILALKNLWNSIESQTMQNFELIVVEETEKWKIKLPYCCNYSKRVNKYCPLSDPMERLFNKSWCINVGIKQAQSNKVLIIDADCIFGKEYFENVLNFSKKYSLFFNGYNWIVLLPGRDNPVIRISHHEDIKSVGGSWFIDRFFFFDKLGGMNENYFGYGREDSDLWLRVNYVLNSIPEIDYPLTHQYHHWEVVNQNDELLAIGRLKLPKIYVKSFSRGIAVNVRKGVYKSKI